MLKFYVPSFNLITVADTTTADKTYQKLASH